jgi:ferric-dicitrate binding protein FerR (iron transport regulator)
MDKEYLIEKWLSNQLTEKELKAFEALEDYPQLIAILDNAQQFKASEFSSMSNFDTFQKRLKTDQKPVRKLSWIKPLLRIASVLVLGIAIYSLYIFNNTIKVQTIAGEKIEIELPDASKVMVNAQSEVKYSKRNWKQKREINLTGEAFFTVAKGSTFDVITTEGTVTVVGTQFNVKQRDEFFEVTCYEGIVNVRTKALSEELRAGENIRFSDGKIIQGQNTGEFPTWLKNISSFHRMPISHVIAEMERQYNIKILLEQVSPEILFTGGFIHNNLDNALKSVTQPLNLEYRMDGSNNVILYPSEK